MYALTSVIDDLKHFSAESSDDAVNVVHFAKALEATDIISVLSEMSIATA